MQCLSCFRLHPELQIKPLTEMCRALCLYAVLYWPLEISLLVLEGMWSVCVCNGLILPSVPHSSPSASVIADVGFPVQWFLSGQITSTGDIADTYHQGFISILLNTTLVTVGLWLLMLYLTLLFHHTQRCFRDSCSSLWQATSDV